MCVCVCVCVALVFDTIRFFRAWLYRLSQNTASPSAYACHNIGFCFATCVHRFADGTIVPFQLELQRTSVNMELRAVFCCFMDDCVDANAKCNATKWMEKAMCHRSETEHFGKKSIHFCVAHLYYLDDICRMCLASMHWSIVLEHLLLCKKNIVIINILSIRINV